MPCPPVKIRGYYDYLNEALDNGLSYSTYYRRVVKLGYPPADAASLPRMKPRRGFTKGSVSDLCRQAGVGRSRYYAIKSELEDEGIDFSVQDVIDIAISRKNQ